MKSRTTLVMLILLIAAQLLGAVPAHADAAADAGMAIFNAVEKARGRRDEMTASGWSAVNADIYRLNDLRTRITSLGSEVASKKSELESIASRVQWLRIEAEAAIARYKQARRALDNDVDDWSRRADALGADIKRHNDNPPNPQDHAAVERYNRYARTLRRRQQRMNREREALLLREAQEVLPLRLAASKKERAHNQKLAEGLRKNAALKEQVATLNKHIDAARALVQGLPAKITAGLRPAPQPRASGSTLPSPPRSGPVDSTQLVRRGDARPSAATDELPLVVPGDRITGAEYRAAKRNKGRVAERLRRMNAELVKVRGRERSAREEQRALVRAKREALRDIFDDLLSLVSVDGLMKRLRRVKGLKQTVLTPRDAERVRAALEATKLVAELELAADQKTDQAQKEKALGALMEGREALERATTNLRSTGDRRLLRQLKLAHKMVKAAARVWKYEQDQQEKPARERYADAKEIGQLVVDLAALVMPAVKVLDSGAKLAVHVGEAAVIERITQDLGVARSMHARAERVLAARAEHYRDQLIELERTIRMYEAR